MKTLSVFLSGLFLFTACGNIVHPVVTDGEKLQHKVEVNGKSFQFLYPEKAQLQDVNGEGEIGLAEYNQSCSGVAFGNVDAFKKNIASRKGLEKVKIEKNEESGDLFESWFLDRKLVFYSKSLSENNFGFMAFDDANDQADCVAFVDELFNSLSSELDYVNEKFGYSVEVPVDFKVDYLENGVLLKKWIEPKEGEDFEAHKISIVVWPIENFDQNQDLATYIGQKYSGYSLEGRDFVKFSGFFVDESSTAMQAKRHFFTMSNDKKIIYEAYMELSSKYYSMHKDFFDQFVEKNFKLL